MKINQIIESTTVVQLLLYVCNERYTNKFCIYGQKKVGNLFKGRNYKLPFSLTEGRVKELSMDLKDLTDEEFQKKYNLTKKEARKILNSGLKKLTKMTYKKKI